jgi:CRISPR/Cas system-associated protein endoribonuclease Cas2
MRSYNRLSFIFTAHHNFKKKFAHLIVQCVKVVYLIYQLTTNTKTMKKETAQFLAVLVAACYLIGQLQDIYSK